MAAHIDHGVDQDERRSPCHAGHSDLAAAHVASVRPYTSSHAFASNIQPIEWDVNQGIANPNRRLHAAARARRRRAEAVGQVQPPIRLDDDVSVIAVRHDPRTYTAEYNSRTENGVYSAIHQGDGGGGGMACDMTADTLSRRLNPAPLNSTMRSRQIRRKKAADRLRVMMFDIDMPVEELRQAVSRYESQPQLRHPSTRRRADLARVRPFSFCADVMM